MKLDDVENQVNLLRTGEAIFSLLGWPNPQVAFLVRERSAVIFRVGRFPTPRGMWDAAHQNGGVQ